MQYFVVMPDGKKYGPADLSLLNQWASEGRITAHTELEDVASGSRLSASSLTGLILEQVPPTSSSTPDWVTPPAASPYPRQSVSYGDNGQRELTMAWVFGSLGLLCCPIVFSTMGIVYALQAKNKGNPGGTAAMIYSICTLIVGVAGGIWANLALGGLSRF